MSPVMIVIGLAATAIITWLWHLYGTLHHIEQRSREAEHLATGALLALKAHMEGEDFDIHVMKLRETEIE